MFNLFGSNKKNVQKSSIQSSRYRVLICDNASFLRLLLKEILIKCNYDVVAEAENGNEAVNAYFKHKPDLVFMDIAMPSMDGITALKQILAKDKEASVIMISAMGQQKLVIEAMMSGAKDFIIKPYNELTVFDTLAKFDSVLRNYISVHPELQWKNTPTNNEHIDENILINEVKTMPVKFDYNFTFNDKYQDMYNTCATILSAKDITAAMSDDIIMKMEYAIQTKRSRTPRKADYDKIMEDNILFEIYKYSYLMNTIVALEKHKDDDVDVDLKNYWSMIQNDCRARMKNLEQEKRNNPAINAWLGKYAGDNRMVSMRMLSQINARENDYVIAGLMTGVLMMMLNFIFGDSIIQPSGSSSQQKLMQFITKYPSKEVCAFIDNYIVNMVVMRTSLYANGGSPLGWN